MTKHNLKRAVSLGLMPSSMSHLLIAILIMLIGVPLTMTFEYADQIHGVLFSIVYVTSLLAVGKNISTLTTGSLLLVPALILRWYNEISPGVIPHYIATLFAIVLLVYVAVNILRFIIKAPNVNSEVVYAGISAYLILGILWAFLYLLISESFPDSFHRSVNATTGPVQLNINEALYFSFITIATVGYGDITAVLPFARTLTYLQAVIGGFYMAILIARLVAKYSSDRN